MNNGTISTGFLHFRPPNKASGRLFELILDSTVCTNKIKYCIPIDTRIITSDIRLQKLFYLFSKNSAVTNVPMHYYVHYTLNNNRHIAPSSADKGTPDPAAPQIVRLKDYLKGTSKNSFFITAGLSSRRILRCIRRPYFFQYALLMRLVYGVLAGASLQN